jgi:hypothetical protein
MKTDVPGPRTRLPTCIWPARINIIIFVMGVNFDLGVRWEFNFKQLRTVVGTHLANPCLRVQFIITIAMEILRLYQGTEGHPRQLMFFPNSDARHALLLLIADIAKGPQSTRQRLVSLETGLLV